MVNFQESQLDAVAHDSELRKLTVEGLLEKTVVRVSDSVTLQKLNILDEKMSKDFSEHTEAGSIVVSGLA